jgi:hypothetical protein
MRRKSGESRKPKAKQQRKLRIAKQTLRDLEPDANDGANAKGGVSGSGGVGPSRWVSFPPRPNTHASTA